MCGAVTTRVHAALGRGQNAGFGPMPPVRTAIASMLLVLTANAAASAQAPGEAPSRAASAPAVTASDGTSSRRPFPRVRWRWRRSDIGDYVTVGVGAATAGSMIGIGAAGAVTRTSGGILFDEDARNALRLSDETSRMIARDVSDGLLTLLTSAPVLLDALVLGAWLHDDPEIALELILIHAEVIAVTLGLQTIANIAASRERPYGRNCGATGPDGLPEGSFFCNSPDRYYSFFSGHTSQSFASAAVVCSAHMNMPLLGGGAADAVPCVTGMALAAVTGLLRVMGDMHYLTDVLTGAVMGTAVGFFLPWALHYAHGRSEGSAAPDVRVSVVPTGTGASLVGIW